ncbi:MAG: polysaccharide deacetylase family protein [Bacteroidaceae bacterium]|nr:polysaccharide deacetylase family protein [Bacteroidaceae bacterium]
MLIEQPARFLRWLYPHALWRMDHRERAVYLTFDDGPIPEATPFVLDTLDRFGAKATFFMVGDNARRYPDLLEEVRRRGHAIGNHTYNHIGGLRWSSWKYLYNVHKAGDVLGHPRLFRPPHGWMRAVQYRTMRIFGYKVVMWDLVTRDYSRRLTAQDVLDNVKRYARPGSIITFHDSLKSIDKLRQMLPDALQWLQNQGYEFRKIEEK